MKLANAARWADQTQLYDAYTGRMLFRAQVSSFIDNQLDGSISKRRPMSFAPDKVVPTRRVVRYGNERWIIGDTLTDYHRRRPVRVSAATKRVTGLFSILTPGEAASGAEGIQAYAQHTYLKDTVDPLTTSLYTPQFEVHFAAGEPVTQLKLVKLGEQYLHARNTYPVLDGFICALCDDLGHARGTATLLLRGAYDAAMDAYAETTQPVNVIEMDYYKLYDKATMDAYKQQPGDLVLLMENTSDPKVGAELEYKTAKWRILGRDSDQDAWRVHIRRV